jgi:hypothetical protein
MPWWVAALIGGVVAAFVPPLERVRSRLPRWVDRLITVMCVTVAVLAFPGWGVAVLSVVGLLIGLFIVEQLRYHSRKRAIKTVVTSEQAVVIDTRREDDR